MWQGQKLDGTQEITTQINAETMWIWLVTQVQLSNNADCRGSKGMSLFGCECAQE